MVILQLMQIFIFLALPFVTFAAIVTFIITGLIANLFLRKSKPAIDKYQKISSVLAKFFLKPFGTGLFIVAPISFFIGGYLRRAFGASIDDLISEVYILLPVVFSFIAYALIIKKEGGSQKIKLTQIIMYWLYYYFFCYLALKYPLSLTCC